LQVTGKLLNGTKPVFGEQPSNYAGGDSENDNNGRGNCAHHQILSSCPNTR